MGGAYVKKFIFKTSLTCVLMTVRTINNHFPSTKFINHHRLVPERGSLNFPIQTMKSNIVNLSQGFPLKQVHEVWVGVI